MKYTLTAAACLITASAALAEPEVTEGLWSYQATATLGIMPIVDKGNYCIKGQQASASFEELLNDINPNCTVTDGTYDASTYAFTLSCTGGPQGRLDGTVSVQGGQATLRATGWTGTIESQVPVIVSASAKKLRPTCS